MAGERLPARLSLRSQLWFRWTGKYFETATSHMQTVHSQSASFLANECGALGTALLVRKADSEEQHCKTNRIIENTQIQLSLQRTTLCLMPKNRAPQKRLNEKSILFK